MPKLSYQDRVPSFTSSKAKNLIEKELGAPVHVLFHKFEDLPIAAASLGQVFALHFLSCFVFDIDDDISDY